MSLQQRLLSSDDLEANLDTHRGSFMDQPLVSTVESMRDFVAEVEEFEPPYKSASIEDPILSPFAGAFQLLGWTRDYWGDSLLRWLHVFVVSVLVCWSAIGWTIRFAYFLKDEQMPSVVGWYEVTASLNDSIPNAYALCGVSVFSYLFALSYFGSRRNEARRLYTQLSRHGECTRAEAHRHVSKVARICWAWTILTASINLLINFGVADTLEHNYIKREPLGEVVYDSAVSVVSYVAQFGSTTFISGYFYCVCSLHLQQIRHFRAWMMDVHERKTILDIFERHQSIQQFVQATSRSWQLYVTCASLLVGVSIASTVLNVFFRHDTELQTSFALRLLVSFILLGPISLSVYRAATVSTELMRLASTINSIPPRTSHSHDATFLRVYMAHEASSGFTLFGHVLTSALLFQILYAFAVFVVAALQFYFSRQTTPTSG